MAMADVAKRRGAKYITRAALARDTRKTLMCEGFKAHERAVAHSVARSWSVASGVVFVYTVNGGYINRQGAYVSGQWRDLVHLQGLVNGTGVHKRARDILEMSFDAYNTWRAQVTEYARALRWIKAWQFQWNCTAEWAVQLFLMNDYEGLRSQQRIHAADAAQRWVNKYGTKFGEPNFVNRILLFAEYDDKVFKD